MHTAAIRRPRVPAPSITTGRSSTSAGRVNTMIDSRSVTIRPRPKGISESTGHTFLITFMHRGAQDRLNSLSYQTCS
jgi:hypothetical protein